MVDLSLVTGNVLATAIENLCLHHCSLIAFARTLYAFSQRVDQLMTNYRSVVVENLLETFVDLGICSDEIDGIVLKLTIRVELLSQSILESGVVVLTEELHDLHAKVHVIDRSCHSELISGVHGWVFVFIELSVFEVVLKDLLLEVKLFELISQGFDLCVAIHGFDLLNTLLNGNELLLSCIPLCLCFLDHVEGLEDDVF